MLRKSEERKKTPSGQGSQELGDVLPCFESTVKSNFIADKL